MIIHGDWCPECDEMILSEENAEEKEQQMSAFKRKINKETIKPDYIQSVRKRLGLNQKDASDLLGGGVNAFSRYETGKMTPPRSLILLLRLLDSRPDLLPEVKALSTDILYKSKQ